MKPLKLKLRGFGLIESIVAGALLSGGVFAYLQWIDTTTRLRTHTRTVAELQLVRSSVINAADCRKTLTAMSAAVCQTGAYNMATGYASSSPVTILKGDGTPLFPNGKLGSFSIKATCLKGANVSGETVTSLVVYASQRDAATGGAQKDAMNSQIVYDYEPIFENGITLCENELKLPAAVPPAFNATVGKRAGRLTASLHSGPWKTAFDPLNPLPNYGCPTQWLATGKHNQYLPVNCNNTPYYWDYFAFANHQNGGFFSYKANKCDQDSVAVNPTPYNPSGTICHISSLDIPLADGSMGVTMACAVSNGWLNDPTYDPCKSAYALNAITGEETYNCVRVR